MGTRLFVGNLSYNTTEQSLRAHFVEGGWEVTDVVIVTERETGRSRGFGFVTFEDAAAADTAMAEMNGTSLDGRTINVNEAQDSKRDGRGGGGGGGGGGGRDRRW